MRAVAGEPLAGPAARDHERPWGQRIPRRTQPGRRRAELWV